MTPRPALMPVPSLEPLRIAPTPASRPPVVPLADAIRRGRLERGPGTGHVQGALAVDFASASDEQVFGPQSTARAQLPDPQDWAGQMAQAIVEVMTGARTAPQLVRWTTPEVYAVVARQGALAVRRAGQAGTRTTRRRVTVRRVVVCEPVDGVAEASVVLVDGSRLRALALRLTGQDGRWRVEALQIG